MGPDAITLARPHRGRADAVGNRRGGLHRLEFRPRLARRNVASRWSTSTSSPTPAICDNLGAPLKDPRHHFVRADIGDQPGGIAAAGQAPAARRRQFRGRKPRRPVDSRPGARSSRPTCVGTLQLLEAARGVLAGLPETGERDAFRFLHVSTDEVYGSLEPQDPGVLRDHAYAPNSPYSAIKAASDHLVRAYHHTYGLPTLTTNCSNNYGPYQFPGKADPADDPQRAGRQAAAGLRRRPEYPRLAVRRGSLRGDPRVLWSAAASARPTTSAATAS